MSQPIYKGELQLARWSDTSTGGAQVTFWLPDGEALEAFKALTARKGGKAGQILAAMIVAVDEADEPQAETGNPVTELKGGELAKLAGQLVRNPAFQEWARLFDARVLNADDADLWLKRQCQITSKKELDHDLKRAGYFHQWIREPFVEWQQRHGRVAA